MNNSDMPAMPCEEERWVDPTNPDLGTVVYDGLTKREYFAAMAMQGLCSDASMKTAEIPAESVKMADAMLEQLEK